MTTLNHLTEFTLDPKSVTTEGFLAEKAAGEGAGDGDGGGQVPLNQFESVDDEGVNEGFGLGGARGYCIDGCMSYIGGDY